MTRATPSLPVPALPADLDPAHARLAAALGVEVPPEEPEQPPRPRRGALAASVAEAEALRDAREGEGEGDEDDPFGCPPAPPPPVVDAGDLAEDPDDWAAHRRALAAAHGVRGALEEELLDRVASLSWRLRRLARAERGAIGARTSGVAVDRDAARRERLPLDRARAATTLGGALGSRSPGLLAEALRGLADLREAVEDRREPPYRDAVRSLVAVWGTAQGGRELAGDGQALAAFLYQLTLRAGGRSVPEDGTPARSAALERRLRRWIVGELRRAEGVLDELLRWHRQDLAREDRAAAEARAIPDAEDLRSLIAYERHLAAELRQARTELERAVARRRLGEMGAGWR